MARISLTVTTMLFVAILSTPAHGQDTQKQDTQKKDSAVTDSSTGSSTRQRFGRLFGKAKTIAQNKNVQDAAKGVACTVVPGAAVATAVSGGGGPCANSGLMNGLMSGKLGGAASALAGGAASGAASTAAAKAMSKGGLTGAAARGAMGGLGGLGGVSGMSNAAAQAAVMKMLQSSGANGMSSARAQIAAMQMLQNQGISNAAAAVILSNMAQNPAAAGMSSADAAKAMKMLQSLNAAGVNASTAYSSNAIPAAATAATAKSIYDDLEANGRVAVQGLLFDTGSGQLRPESKPALKQVAAMLEQHPELRLRIEGHPDNAGTKDVSEKSAAAVKAALIGDYHVSAGRLQSKGFGDSKSAGTNAVRIELVEM
jgi:outer membrane protein OmpA-like peptidoglycan-associated protein